MTQPALAASTANRNRGPFRGPAAYPVALAALTVTSVLAVATAHQMAVGRREAAAANEAASRKDWPEAIRHARAAAEAFVPASPWPERGERCLQAIGHDAEARGDGATALLSYGAARTAALATQAPGASGSRWRSEAEAGLARVAGWDAAAGTDGRPAAAMPREAAQSMIEALTHEPIPSPWSFAALSASVVAVLGGIGWLALAVGADGRRARLAQGLVAVGLVTYAAVLLLN
jgi:hypothetical protein